MSKFNAIHLVRLGNFAVVRMEVEGRWVELIREPYDAPFSHIVEPSGIEDLVQKLEAERAEMHERGVL